MKILLGYSYYNSLCDQRIDNENWVARLRQAGFDVVAIPLTVNPPGPCFVWNELDARWKRGDKELLSLYERIIQKVEETQCNVFLNFNGINLHPEFVKQLPTTNVYACFDDPESSEYLSRPVAWAYDLCLVGNIAEVETYKKWGVKNAYFWPLGFRENEYSRFLTENDILTGDRDVGLSLLCERQSNWRFSRLEQYTNAFPKGIYYGRGWKNGFLPNEKKIKLYQNTKIGPNFHNSTGPINFRTYELPANGVMQICDNKSYLAKIFELGKEVVGFESVEEAIELTRYYLTHDEERKKIAAAGWRRAIRDYNEVAVFQRAVDYISQFQNLKSTVDRKSTIEICANLKKHSNGTKLKRISYKIKQKIGSVFS